MEYTNSSIFGNNGGVEGRGDYREKHEVFPDNSMELRGENREKKEEFGSLKGELSGGHEGRPELGEIVSEQVMIAEKQVQNEDHESILGTDMPKMSDRDGIEKEYMKKIDEVKKEKDFRQIGRAYRALRKKLLYERYGRVIGESK